MLRSFYFIFILSLLMVKPLLAQPEIQFTEDEKQELRKFHQLKRSILGQLEEEKREELFNILRHREREEVRKSVQEFRNLSSEEKSKILLQGKKELLKILEKEIRGEVIEFDTSLIQIFKRIPPPKQRFERPRFQED